MALRTGFGTGAYSAGKYGYPEVFEGQSAVSVTSVVSQADAQRIHLGGAAASASTSSVVSAQRIAIASASITPAISVTANGYFSSVGRAAVTITASMTDSYVRIRPFSASESVTSEVSQRDARYKWIPVTKPTDTWTEASYRGD